MSTRRHFPQVGDKTNSQPQLALVPIKIPVVVSVIGKPGSGKSTLIEFLNQKFQSHMQQQPQLYNDRDVLLHMAHAHNMDHLIRARDSMNFDILDDRAYDVAIDQLITTVCKAADDRVSLVEFSRKDYSRTFRRFGALLAHDKSLIVYVKTPFQMCKERNIRRAVLESSHSVPADEMESYFRIDDIEQLIRQHRERVIVVSNEFEKTDLLHRVDELCSTLKQRIY